MSSELIERLRKYGLTLEQNVVICDRAAVDEAAATIAQLQAELAEAREVPGRIAAWLVSLDGPDLDPEMPIAGSQFGILMQASDVIKSRDWSKP